MRLWSTSWGNGDRIPARYAAGRLDPAGGVTFSENLNPHLAWAEVPAGARSFALICHDFDVPSRGDDVNKADREVPSDLPRVDFFHWVMVDLPAGLREIAEGEHSHGFTPRGKSGPAIEGRPAFGGARHGLNDYTGWFAADAAMAGQYFGYDGPWPPPNDLRVHRYFFRLFALDVDRLPVPDRFTAADVFDAMHGHVLTEASTWGTYSLNPDVHG